jgi:hypothetical protein
MYRLLLITIITIFIVGCGGGGDESNSSLKTNKIQTSTTKVAYLIDSAVSGVEYTCGKIGGVTGQDGDFLYNDTCKITFKIGNVILGEIDANSINSDQRVIPADLIGVNRDNITNEKVICMIQFLQSLDKDNNPENNIEISQTIRDSLTNSTLDFSSNQLNDSDIETTVLSTNKNLVSKELALRHYISSLKKDFSIDIVQEVEETQEIDFVPFVIPNIQETQDIQNTEVVQEVESTQEIDFVPIVTPTIQETQDIQDTEVVQEVESTQEIDFVPIVTQDIYETQEIEVVQDVEEQQLELFLEEEQNNSTVSNSNESSIDPQTQSPFTTIVSNLESLNDTEEDIQGFSYANQRDVNIEISVLSTLFNKQILFFESARIITTPVGDIKTFENKILSTVFNNEGKLNIKYTFANHLTSIWMVIPYHGIQMEVPIVNNRIYITLNEGESL